MCTKIKMKYFLLADNVYQPSRCQEVLEELRKCCIKHSANSTVCDGINTSKPYEHNTIDYVSPTYICFIQILRVLSFISYAISVIIFWQL